VLLTATVNKAIARSQLTGVLINMQQNMIQSLQRLLLSTSSAPVVDYTSLLNISDRSRLDSISALAQQYQRFSTAAPIQKIPLRHASLLVVPDFCPGALELQNGPAGINYTSWRCSFCKAGAGEEL
jgi:hypothetical protein